MAAHAAATDDPPRPTRASRRRRHRAADGTWPTPCCPRKPADPASPAGPAARPDGAARRGPRLRVPRRRLGPTAPLVGGMPGDALASRREDRQQVDIVSDPADRGDAGQARIPVLDLDRLRAWLTDGNVRLGRVAVVSVELDNLNHVNERLGYRAGCAPHRGDHPAPALGDAPARRGRARQPGALRARVPRRPRPRRGRGARGADRDGGRAPVGGGRGRRRGDRQHRCRARGRRARAPRERAPARDQGGEPRRARSAAPRIEICDDAPPDRVHRRRVRHRAHQRAARAPLPADRELRDRAHRRVRDAHALGPPRARAAAAGRVPPAGRAHRRHRADGPVGASSTRAGRWRCGSGNATGGSAEARREPLGPRVRRADAHAPR